jgi:alkanesulfonate monooxygenase SsuD/methylene tetrahydromethanopterin reductase-like flavin-dependent oxidoreductase (luciferase family)
VTQVPERWTGSWQDNLRLARIADEAGIEFMLPIARWKGYGGDTDYHPLIAAKQFVTADHIGQGRFGLNLVVGWNEDEFEMFGVRQRDHEARYEYAQEWIDAVKMAWGPQDDFEFSGEFIKLKKVRAKPKPYGGSRPLIMNAGASPTGRAFAIRNCDAFFTQASRTSLTETAQRVQEAKAAARGFGRELDVYAVAVLTCRRTKKEAEDFYHYAIIENADWSAVDGILGKKNISPATVGEEEFTRQRHHYAHGLGGLLMVGDPDEVAQQLADLSNAGLHGIGLSLVNYAEELPFFCDEVLPRLQRLGAREKR